MLYIATLIHTSSGKVVSASGIVAPHDISDTELIARIKSAVSTHIIVSHYPHTVEHTDTGITIRLDKCRYHIDAVRLE
jgi:hypothetical protein